MIVIKDDRVSEYYAAITLPAWKKAGYNVQRFDAWTPNNFPTDFTINFRFLATVKYVDLKIKKDHTPTEKACWYSHLSLWKKCIDLGRPVMILEHDSYPFFPQMIDVEAEHDFVTYDSYGMGCYIISPTLAKLAWDKIVTDKCLLDIGPYGFIKELNEKNPALSCVFFTHSDFVPAASQIHDVSVGATIDHFVGTEAEPFKKELGMMERIDYDKKLKLDVKRKIFTIVG